jgi:hypothetical protein
MTQSSRLLPDLVRQATRAAQAPSPAAAALAVYPAEHQSVTGNIPTGLTIGEVLSSEQVPAARIARPGHREILHITIPGLCPPDAWSGRIST